jgi:glutamate synthase (NADPH/NADH) large chain/glutamate synthase (ferredoxin)
MAGGEIVIRPKATETYVWSENVIVGNTCLYGATGGTFFAAGWAGERFAVRNSGATAVVEGVGDHGCEYMTRGTVVILGRVGKNFGAGMSGGLAFVHDAHNALPGRINPQMVSVERLNNEEEVASLKQLVSVHARLTGSPHARALLESWETEISRFWKVLPNPATPDAPKQVYAFDPTKIPIAS